MIAFRHPREGGDPYGAVSTAGTGRPGGIAIEPKSRAMGPRLRGDDDTTSAGSNAARDFEALFIAQLLKAARAAHLAEDPLAPDDGAFRDAQDRDLARRLATAAPLGVAKLLK